ncbi:MAG: hypothetical protein K8S54_00135 [Spirochaetia bacterium]|nr:hypothetical protein [Spirochaetia bacterium]
MRMFAACLLAVLACQRLKEPPRPASIPAEADRDRRTGLWSLKTAQESVTYYSDGSLYSKGPVGPLGERTGHWAYYSPGAKQTLSQGEFVRDWRDGIWNFYDEKGRLYLSMTYAQEPKRDFIFLVTHDYGNENGTYRRYYPDGRLEEEGGFKAGYYEGPVTRYHPNGRPLLRGQYQKDTVVGRWLYYYPDGTLLREENYVNGALDGKLRSFYPDGRVYVESNYKDGVRSETPIVHR